MKLTPIGTAPSKKAQRALKEMTRFIKPDNQVSDRLIKMQTPVNQKVSLNDLYFSPTTPTGLDIPNVGQVIDFRF